MGRRQLTIRVETEEDLALGTTYTLTLNEIAVYDLPAPSQAKLSAAERDEIWEKVIAWKVTNRKVQVGERGEHRVILVRKRWTGREYRETISVDEYGLVTATEPGRPRWEPY